MVTGGNSGIGRAIAISLGKAGANVVVNYVVKPEEAEAVAAEIRKGGQRAMIAQADVSDEAQVQAMFAAAVREFGTDRHSREQRRHGAQRAVPRDDRRAVGLRS